MPARTKRNYRKSYRRRSKYHKRRAEPKRQTREGQYFKLRAVVPINCATTTGMFNVAFSVSDPSAYYNPENAGYSGMMTEWTNLNSLYDSYKVNAVALKWVPLRPNDTTSSMAFQPMYVVPDVDTANTYTVINTADKALQYEASRVMNLNLPWKYYFKCPSYTQSAGIGKGWIDVALPLTSGSITLLCDQVINAASGYPVGNIIFTMYIACKNRR